MEEAPQTSSRAAGEVDERADSDAEDGDEKPTSLHERSSAFSGSTSTEAATSRTDIFLHLEVLDGTQHKIAQGVYLFTICAAVALLAMVFYFRRDSDKGERESKWRTANLQKYENNRIVFKLSLAVSCLCICLLWPMLAWFIRRLLATRKCNWTRRQRYLVAIAFLQLVFQSINVLFWLIPNAYVISQKCGWFDGIVNASVYIRWTCWNSIFCLTIMHAQNCCPAMKKQSCRDRKKSDPCPDRGNPRFRNNERDPMYLDGNFLRVHWFKLLFWVGLEASIIYLAASGGVTWLGRDIPDDVKRPVGHCTALNYSHVVPKLKYHIVRFIWGGLLLIYQIWTQWKMRIALARLKTQPYNCYQLANLLLLWQKRQGMWMDLLGIVEVSAIYFAYQNLVAYFQQWTGQPALQVLVTGAILLNAFYFLPMEPSNEEHMYRAYLQEFVWTVDQIPRRQQALLLRSPTMGPHLHEKPLFCFETALKLLLWSDVVYDGSEGELNPGLAGTVRADLEAKPAADSTDSSPSSSREELIVLPPDTTSTQITAARHKVHEVDEPGIAANGSDQGLSASPSGSSDAETAKLATGPISVDAESEDSSSENGDSQDGKKPPHMVVKVDGGLSGKEQLGLAKQMYDIEELRVIHGPVTDTKVVIGWGRSTMVLTFRGTSSMANVRSDAKAWRAAHPPERGTYWLGTKPFIHKGFLRAWQEVAEPVLELVNTVLKGIDVPPQCFKVLLTGHSLGGALATLAAFDIQQAHHLPNLACYTFGAPRTGNTAFAKEFSQICPDCWHVINDRDAVPRTGKMIWMYKRPGERVLLSCLGDIRVRPNVFEVNLLTHGFSVKQHLLTAYLKAFGSVCVAQLFKYKAVDGGLRGVKRLSRKPAICKLLSSIGVDLKVALKHPPLEIMQTIKGRCKWTTPLIDAVRDLDPLVFSD